MFKLATNEEIGKYLSGKIESKYPSARQFAITYLEERNTEVNEEETRKMSNRLSQIINGKKSIQIADLPYFSKILNVSCEELISAGTCFAATSNHLTNYAISFSKDENVWKEYLNRDDNIILNSDEYGLTVIDYALKFKNYEFLKYLLDEKYIWFVGDKKDDLFYGFGAGTKIKFDSSHYKSNLNVLDSVLKEKYDLRVQMIILAIENEDLNILEKLHAREIPELRRVCHYSAHSIDCNKEYDSDLINAIAKSNNRKILEYFSNQFEIVDRISITNKFMFPFTSEIIDILLEHDSVYTEMFLKSAIVHNKYAYEKVKKLVQDWVDYFNELYGGYETVDYDSINKFIEKIVYLDNGHIISYRNHNARDGIITNIIKTDAASDKKDINFLIDELNDLYNKIINIKAEDI